MERVLVSGRVKEPSGFDPLRFYCVYIQYKTDLDGWDCFGRENPVLCPNKYSN